MLAFDAPSREECTAERPRSNIPQQALVLLNDPTYVEAARVLAQRALDACDGDDARLRWIFRRTLSRAAASDEIEILRELLAGQRRSLAERPGDAKAVLAVGQAPPAPAGDPIEVAAWVAVARAVLNLHETVTRN